MLVSYTLEWLYNEHNGVSNHRLYDCLFNSLLRLSSKKTSKTCVTGLCNGNPPVTGGFPSQRACNAENVSIWWRHQVMLHTLHIHLMGSVTYWNHNNWFTNPPYFLSLPPPLSPPSLCLCVCVRGSCGSNSTYLDHAITHQTLWNNQPIARGRCGCRSLIGKF